MRNPGRDLSDDLAQTMGGRPAGGAARSVGKSGDIAPWAVSAQASRGRLVPEPDCPMRTPYQRDRDRIVHSAAFRRLTHKTQVFVYHEGDHFRSRLTHSLEVAQIARAIARQLRADEDLAEALALAHDLGHTPFGHAGERALDRVMQGFGGFDHNAQSLRVVTKLEGKYAAFDGLNLSWESLEGLAKHNGPLLGGVALAGDASSVGWKGHVQSPDTKGRAAALPRAIAHINAAFDLRLDSFASAEAQIAAISDDIAYNNHDIDDGLRAGLIMLRDLQDVPLIAAIVGEISVLYGDLPEERMAYEVTRRLITRMIEDVVRETRSRIDRLAPGSADDIRAAGLPVVAFSGELEEQVDQLRHFLFGHVYRHARVMNVMVSAEHAVEALFDTYYRKPSTLPGTWGDAARATEGEERAWLVGDFVACMTDRYAINEHVRLFDARPELL